MPDENQHPSPQPSQSDSPASAPQVIQPMNSNTVSPSSPNPEPQPVVSPPITQPTAMVNGQPHTPTTPMSSGQIEQMTDQKPSKWRYFFIVIGILQAAGIALFLLVMLWAAQQAKAGVSGTEFIALILFVTVVPAVAVISLVNLIGLPIYMRKQKLHGKRLVFAIISLAISALLVLYGAYNVYGLTVYPKKLSEKSRQKSEQRQQEFAAANVKPEITREEAISFMQSCKADYFVGYTDINLVKDSNTKSWLNKAEQSTTGIEISEGSPKSYVFASKAMTTALQDTARQFRQSCYNTKKLYITVDNWIETEYPQGKWTRVNQ